MAIKIQSLSRVFAYGSITLPDPGGNLVPEQVKEMFAAAYPELTNATVEGPETKGDKMIYTFRRAVGTKG